MFECSYCDSEFETGTALGGHVAATHSDTKSCKYCGREFLPSNIESHLNVCGQNPNRSLKRGNCKNCGDPKPTCNRKFCSNECQQEHQVGRRLDVIAETEEANFDVGEEANRNWIKKYLIQEHGEECMKCGWSEVNPHTGNIPVELDHIDGDHTNHTIENCRLLCPNCHSLTKTYKGANAGNGRTHRRK